MESQLKFLHDVWSTLPPRFQVHLNSILALINSKLLEATNILDRTIGERRPDSQIADIKVKEGRLRRGAFAFSIKDSLDDTIRDIDAWQRNMLDPSWYQMVLIPGKRIGQIASQHLSDHQDPGNAISSLRNIIQANEESSNVAGIIFISNECIEYLPSQIEFSESRLGRDKRSGTLVILDAVKAPTQYGGDRAIDDIGTLATKLSRIDSSAFGFLQCRGALRNANDFEFLFSFLKDGDENPTSLRRLLINAEEKYPLNARVNLAQMLARSITFMHSCKLVHKNVRPENIICFSKQNSYHDHPYLTGLERFRHIDTFSMRASDNFWQRDIYRHPSRQGTRPERDYVMQHDIYSLGVCLLEVGLWKSFFDWDEDSGSMSANEGFISRTDFSIKDPRRRAFEIKKQFTQAARECLPGSMGQKYAAVVVSCLTCLHPGNVDFGDENRLEDGDGILVGVRCVEKVCESTSVWMRSADRYRSWHNCSRYPSDLCLSASGTRSVLKENHPDTLIRSACLNSMHWNEGWYDEMDEQARRQSGIL